MSAASRAAPVASPYELLDSRADRSRPFVTSYDGPDSCTELSVTTTLNTVAKAAGVLRDELGLEPGDWLSVDLPVHWQLPVWTLAGLTVGLVVAAHAPEQVAARVVGPDGLAAIAAGVDPHADDVLGCSCDAFGLPVAGGVPSGALDVGIVVRAHPDVFQVDRLSVQHAGLVVLHEPPADEPGHPAYQPSRSVGPGALAVLPWPRLVAAEPVDPQAARTWVSADSLGLGRHPSVMLRRAAVDPVLRAGSVVLARNVSAAQAAHLRSVHGAREDRLP